jgi:hypothetical protein
MAALWPAFITTVGSFLDAKIPKTEEATASFIANAYRVAVTTSAIQLAPLPFVPTVILTTPSAAGIKKGFVEAFNESKEKNSIEKSHFNTLSGELISFWENVTWNPLPPPPLYAGPDPTGLPLINPGINIQFAGDAEVISSLLNDVFSPPPLPSSSGIVFATRLANAFQAHMYSINGFYKGLVPGFPTPVPGPPFPWVAIT